MNLSYLVVVPGRGEVRVAGPRLAGYSGPFTAAEAEAAVLPANLPPSVAAVMAAADAAVLGGFQAAGVVLTEAQADEVRSRVSVEIQYEVSILMEDMIGAMPDKDFCRVPPSSIVFALALGGITAPVADLGFTRLAQLTLLGMVPGAIHPEIRARLGSV